MPSKKTSKKSVKTVAPSIQYNSNTKRYYVNGYSKTKRKRVYLGQTTSLVKAKALQKNFKG